MGGRVTGLRCLLHKPPVPPSLSLCPCEDVATVALSTSCPSCAGACGGPAARDIGSRVSPRRACCGPHAATLYVALRAPSLPGLLLRPWGAGSASPGHRHPNTQDILPLLAPQSGPLDRPWIPGRLTGCARLPKALPYGSPGERGGLVPGSLCRAGLQGHTCTSTLRGCGFRTLTSCTTARAQCTR